MKRNLLLAIFSLLLVCQAFGQRQVTGTVTDAEAGEGRNTIRVDFDPFVEVIEPGQQLVWVSGALQNAAVGEDGTPVAWEDLVKGYEYQKGRYVVLTKEDFKAAAVEKEEEPEEVTESLKLDRKLPRTQGRPAEA